MKTFTFSVSIFLQKITLFFFSIIILNGNSFAGDIKISMRINITKYFENEENEMPLELENVENFPVEGVAFNMVIKHKLSSEIVYQYSKQIGTVAPKSKQTITPLSWAPTFSGDFKLQLQLSSLNDINPANDTASYDLQVLPKPIIGYHFNQINFTSPFMQENSNSARIDFTILPNDTNMYANFVFATPDNSQNPKWLAQNVILPAFPDTQEISYWIDLEKLGIQNGTDVQELMYDFKFSMSPTLNLFENVGFFIGKVEDDEYNVGGDNPIEHDLGPITSFPTVEWGENFKVKTWNYRGCTVPNIDLDSSKYNPRDMEGEVGDWNCCAPAAATNSLQWLENTDKNIPKTNLTHREKLKLFNQLSGRQNEDGLNTGNTIRGKLAYIDSLKLPIHVKWQGVPYADSIASPNPRYKHFAESKNDSAGAWCTFEWLAAEIEKGEDVELKFGWYDSTGVRHDGHWVVVSGVSDVTTARGIYVKDDEKQRGEGGMRQTYVNWVTNEQGRPRLTGFKAVNNYCWVESVVSESYDSTITYGIKKPEIKNIKVEEGPANWKGLKGLFEFSFPASDEAHYLNVFAGKRASPAAPTQIVKNLVLPPFNSEQKLSAWFDFSWLAFQQGDDISEIDLGYEVSEEVVDNSGSQYMGTLLTYPVTKEIMNISLNYTNRPKIEIKMPANELPVYDFEPYKTWEYRGCNVPNIDLDSTTFNPTTVPGYAGDKNACGPAGAANSMQWLENKYTQINSGTTHREKLKELSSFMRRTNNSQVTDKNFVKGKLAFIDKYKLPIKVKMQGIFFGSDSIPSPNATYGHFAHNKNDSTNAYPKWDWLVNEIKEDEDVEIGVAWYDSTGNPLGGHWLTVSGVSEVGKYKGMYVKDDGNQKIAGGTKQQFSNVDFTSDGKPFLVQMSSANSVCLLEAVVSESYDETMSFIPLVSEDISILNQLNLKVYENPSSKLEPIKISFEINGEKEATVSIFSFNGKLIYRETHNFETSGLKTIEWDGKQTKGLQPGSGTYLIQVQTKTKKATVKIIRQD